MEEKSFPENKNFIFIEGKIIIKFAVKYFLPYIFTVRLSYHLARKNVQSQREAVDFYMIFTYLHVP